MSFNFKTKVTGTSKVLTGMDKAFEKMSDAMAEIFAEGDAQSITNEVVTVIVKEGEIKIQGKPTSITLNGEKLK